MELFSEFTALLEQYITTKMAAAIPGFDMAAFCALVRAPRCNMLRWLFYLRERSYECSQGVCGCVEGSYY